MSRTLHGNEGERSSQNQSKIGMARNDRETIFHSTSVRRLQRLSPLVIALTQRERERGRERERAFDNPLSLPLSFLAGGRDAEMGLVGCAEWVAANCFCE